MVNFLCKKRLLKRLNSQIHNWTLLSLQTTSIWRYSAWELILIWQGTSSIMGNPILRRWASSYNFPCMMIKTWSFWIQTLRSEGKLEKVLCRLILMTIVPQMRTCKKTQLLCCTRSLQKASIGTFFAKNRTFKRSFVKTWIVIRGSSWNKSGRIAMMRND